ncbi:hypothetical protein LG198_08735 [Methylobacillus arboreus]|uniref:hypothetical protein n=1 Tax=Methylobacillus arboreus TaxID=755170 RepID=UPI001E36F53E|nr:hypothetical protein [Methylobacillus arboreus]MCB5190809.1 hypothetical protein [Methylobacillus arboreus]
MNKPRYIKTLSALALALLTTAMSLNSAYADRDDRRDRGQRQEQRSEGHRPDANRSRGGWDQQRQPDRRVERRSQPVVVQNVHYNFRDNDRQRLQTQYQRSLRSLNRDHRPYFQPGYAVLPAYRPYITPVPVHVLQTLPPPPPGYVIGYYQGYNVVYDPTTYIILTTIDLLTR